MTDQQRSAIAAHDREVERSGEQHGETGATKRRVYKLTAYIVTDEASEEAAAREAWDRARTMCHELAPDYEVELDEEESDDE